MSYASRTKRPPRTLTDREVKQVLRAAGKARDGHRDYVIICFGLGCGLRESEITALDVPDVTLDGVRPKRVIQLRVFKRAGLDVKPEDQRCHVPDALYYQLEKYLRAIGARELLAQHAAGKRPGLQLFTSAKGNRLSTRALRGMWQKWQRVAGFDQHYPFHTLRHTAISNVRRETGDIRLAQRVARHANIDTTVRYDHPSDDEVSRAVKGLLG